MLIYMEQFKSQSLWKIRLKALKISRPEHFVNLQYPFMAYKRLEKCEARSSSKRLYTGRFQVSTEDQRLYVLKKRNKFINLILIVDDMEFCASTVKLEVVADNGYSQDI